MGKAGTVFGRLYGHTPHSSSGRGRVDENKALSFIHGRTLQLELYKQPVLLGDVIPDIADSFASLLVSAAKKK